MASVKKLKKTVQRAKTKRTGTLKVDKKLLIEETGLQRKIRFF